MSVKTIRYLLLLATMSAIAHTATAQWSVFQRRQTSLFRFQLRSNFTVNYGAGLSSFMASTDLKNATRLGFNTHLQLGYTFLWYREAGFHTGLGIRYARGGFSADNVESETMGYMTAYNNEVAVTRSTHYTARVSSIDEAYSAFFLELPLQLTYQSGAFWIDYGIKLLLPLSVKASYEYGETSVGAGRDIDGFGTHVDVPVEINRMPALDGSYTVGTLGGGGFAYPAYIVLALNGGYRLALDRKKSLQFGFFIDFALNRTPMGSSDGMMKVVGEDFAFNTVLQSNLVRSLRYMDCGISVTYNLTFGKRIAYRRDKYHFTRSR